MTHAPRPSSLLPLKGTRIVSLALNLPGPAALMRCQQMGARCVKIEPPPHPTAPAGTPGDALGLYNRPAYDQLHQGVKVLCANLKSKEGQAVLHRQLKKADILLTSFRPSALKKLGLSWKSLHQQYPSLSWVTIVGAPGKRAEEPGHDLTYQAENDLISGLNLPRTLAADMAGALMASEAILQSRLHQLRKKRGSRIEVALSESANFLAMPHWWGLTQPGSALGGGHAGYKVYPCQDGRVAVAALEAHFAVDLARLVGLPQTHIMAMFAPESHTAMQSYFANKTRVELEQIAKEHDIPLCTLPAQA
jgi:alpha-methylacyl-CoA racemase